MPKILFLGSLLAVFLAAAAMAQTTTRPIVVPQPAPICTTTCSAGTCTTVCF